MDIVFWHFFIFFLKILHVKTKKNHEIKEKYIKEKKMNTKNHQKEFSKESIDIYLKKLSKVYKKLSAGRMPAEIILVGGSAIAVNYSFRQSSTDIDAIIQAPDVMRDAIFRIRDEENLPNDWINSDFTKTASFSPMLRLYSKHYRTFSNVVEVRTITGAFLIAMKMRSGRIYKHDLSDIIGILIEESENRENQINITEIRDACEKLYGEQGYDTMPEISRKLVESAVNLNIQELRNLYQQQTETEAENCRLLVQFDTENPGILNSENLTEIVENLRQS